MDYIALGHRVRQYRLYRKLTQEGLSALVGISASFTGHIERGSRKASMATMVAIANALQIPTDVLLTDSLRFQAQPRKGAAARHILGLIDDGPDAP